MTTEWPVVYKDQLILGNPESEVAVCTLWTPKERVAATLDPKDYAVIGNLYSMEGVNHIIENLLANPKIRVLVITGTTLSEILGRDSEADSIHGLTTFFALGPGMVTLKMGKAKNSLRFDRNGLMDVYNNVLLIDLRHPAPGYFGEEFVKRVENIPLKGPYAEPRRYPPAFTPLPLFFPSEGVGHVIHRPTIIAAWQAAISQIMRFGYLTDEGTSQRRRELVGLMTVIDAPLMSMDIPPWAPFTSDQVYDYVEGLYSQTLAPGVAYQYGDRLFNYFDLDQAKAIIARLQQKPVSRGAFAALWDPYSDFEREDAPCITHIQAVIRDSQLHLLAYIRTNDMWRAYPSNAAALSSLQEDIARGVGVPAGQLSILSFAAHIYEDCWDVAREAVNAEGKYREGFHQDPRGNIVLKWDDGHFVADLYSPNGELLHIIRKAQQRAFQLALLPYISQVDHAMYIGREVDRLARLKGKYVQDKV